MMEDIKYCAVSCGKEFSCLTINYLRSFISILINFFALSGLFFPMDFVLHLPFITQSLNICISFCSSPVLGFFFSALSNWALQGKFQFCCLIYITVLTCVISCLLPSLKPTYPLLVISVHLYPITAGFLKNLLGRKLVRKMS